jgi:DNA-binding PadR family transcriptional regulator
MKNKDYFDSVDEDLGETIRGTIFRNMEKFSRSLGDSPKMGHGDITPNVLRALKEKPMHGYELIQHLERKSHGMWRPSPGSIYPILQSLVDQDLVKCEEKSGKKVYELTKEGLAATEKLQEDDSPMSRFDDTASHWRKASACRNEIARCFGALHNINHHGSGVDYEKALQIIKQAADSLSELSKEINHRN